LHSCPGICPGYQSPGWAFDVTAYQPPDLKNEHIACEVKKSVFEVDQLVALMAHFGQNQPTGELGGHKKNAHRKVQALRERRPPLFWAVGPDVSQVFRVTYDDELVMLKPTSSEELRYVERS
jgi:hypothetical protein